jgi:uncharacterized membrane protein YqiK
MPSILTSSPFLVVAGVVILILLIAFVASRYHVAGANEALIVAGSRGAKVRDEKGQTASMPGDKGVKVVVGGGTFIRPLLDRVGRLKLTARQINVQLRRRDKSGHQGAGPGRRHIQDRARRRVAAQRSRALP